MYMKNFLKPRTDVFKLCVGHFHIVLDIIMLTIIMKTILLVLSTVFEIKGAPCVSVCTFWLPNKITNSWTS